MLNDIARNASSALVFGHKNPDGDSLCAMLAMGSFYKNEFGGDITFSVEGHIPDNLRFISDKWWLRKPADIKDIAFDLAINVDTGNIDNLTGEDTRELWLRSKKKIKIDHHRNSPENADINVIQQLSSTCEILSNVALGNNWMITRDIAELLYTGIFTDTGGFTADYSTPNTMRIAAMLLEIGKINHSDIVRKLNERAKQTFYNNLHTMSRTLFTDGDKIGFTTFSVKSEAPHCDTYLVHDQIMSVRGTVISAIFTELEGNKVRVNLRSKDKNIPVNSFAAEFGGGGHPQMAAFIFDGGLDEAVAAIVPMLNAVTVSMDSLQKHRDIFKQVANDTSVRMAA